MRAPITSPQNARIKQIIRLRQRRRRDELRLTVVEGVREIALAWQSGIRPQAAYICPELATDPQAANLIAQLDNLAETAGLPLFEITPDLFARIAYRGHSGGILLLISYWETGLNKLPLGERPFLAVIEEAEKPGNLGAILRTADAAGVDGIIVCHAAGGTDLYNPNVIRASLGAIFTVPVAMATPAQAIEWLRRGHIPIVAATPDAATLYTAVDLTPPVAIVTGSESAGLSQDWLAAAATRVAIPMHGAVDSLNLSVSTALLLYEVVRQRQTVLKLPCQPN